MFVVCFVIFSAEQQSKQQSALSADCPSGSEMVVGTPRFPTLTLCFVVGGHLVLAPSAFIYKKYPAEAAFATNCNVHVATAAAAVNSRNGRPGLLSFKRVTRARPWREFSAADRLGSTPVKSGEEGDVEEAQEGDFVPTKVRRQVPGTSYSEYVGTTQQAVLLCAVCTHSTSYKRTAPVPQKMKRDPEHSYACLLYTSPSPRD